LDRFCATTADERLHPPGAIEEPPADGSRPRWPTVAERAAAEVLLALPAAPYPATVELVARVSADASAAFRGNRYSMPPGLAGVQMQLRQRLGSATLEIHSPAGVCLGRHRLAPARSGALVRSAEHREALEAVVLSAFTTASPCERKGNYPPGEAARAEASRLLTGLGPEVVVDLGTYAELMAPAEELGA
jgi:hypothetical protein